MKTIITITAMFATLFTNAQINPLKINSNIVLPSDSSERYCLLNSLNQFLVAAQNSNSDNKFILESEKLETLIQLNEISGITENMALKNKLFYQPYLTNVVKFNDSIFLIKVSYIGITDNISMLRANLEFIGHRLKDSFKFSSPLIKNTKNWKNKQIGNVVIHYKDSVDNEKVNEFANLISFYDNKLKINDKITHYYCTNNSVELQELIGLDYNSDYNGVAESALCFAYHNEVLIILGNNNSTFNTFDPHDLFHDRLNLIISRNKVNAHVDEGCAYLYGGSWGYTWKEIFQTFKDNVAFDKTTNWSELIESKQTFNTGIYPNSVFNIINALLVKKIETEIGFDGVWRLLNTGPYESGYENYNIVLNETLGITKTNFNEKIWELIMSEK